MYELVGLIIGGAIGIILNIIFSAITSTTASRNGRSGAAWGVLTFFFGVSIPVLLLLLISQEIPSYKDKKIYIKEDEKLTKICNGQPMPTTPPIRKTVSEKWTCPKCGEENNINALHCINCFADKPK
ncbi:MAG: hypothetical protein IJZ73_06070 [Clostridia bacterium]|nr:hypothetical protein [Clostridia bacterium]